MNQQNLNMVPITDVFCMPNEQDQVEQVEKPLLIPMGYMDNPMESVQQEQIAAQEAEDDIQPVIQQELKEMQTIQDINDANSNNGVLPFNIQESFGDSEPIWSMIGIVTFGVIALLIAGIFFSKKKSKK